MRSLMIGTGVVALALAFGPAGALAQAPKSKSNQAQSAFCHVTSGTMARNCTYASMAACEDVRKSQGGSCERNAGTTGSGSAGKMAPASGSSPSATSPSPASPKASSNKDSTTKNK